MCESGFTLENRAPTYSEGWGLDRGVVTACWDLKLFRDWQEQETSVPQEKRDKGRKEVVVPVLRNWDHIRRDVEGTRAREETQPLIGTPFRAERDGRTTWLLLSPVLLSPVSVSYWLDPARSLWQGVLGSEAFRISPVVQSPFYPLGA